MESQASGRWADVLRRQSVEQADCDNTSPTTTATTPIPDGKTAYATNWGTNSVTPIDTATNTPDTPIAVGRDPFGAQAATTRHYRSMRPVAADISNFERQTMDFNGSCACDGRVIGDWSGVRTGARTARSAPDIRCPHREQAQRARGRAARAVAVQVDVLPVDLAQPGAGGRLAKDLAGRGLSLTCC